MPRILFKKNEHNPVDLHEAVTVGRSEKHANVVVKDNRLSRAHCRFEPTDDGWSIVDLESQNGTFLNGRRVRSAMVKPGDVVTIGACDMVIEENTGPGGKTVMAGVQSTRGSGLELINDEEAVPPGAEGAAQDSTRTVVAPAALVLSKGSLEDKIHPITSIVFRIGRKHDNELCLEGDGKASGYHAKITRKGLKYVIEDLGSTNGVLVNGKKIDGPVELKNGMKVVVGQQLFRFELQGREPESSGKTAPLQAGEVKERLSPPDQAGERDDLRDPAPGQGDDMPPTVQADAGELDAVNEDDDTAALSRQVKYKGGGSTLFKAIEAVVVIAVAGAVLFAAYTMLGDNDDTGDGESGNFPPSRDGGLLEANSSFEDVDEGGFPRAWSYLVNGTDSFNLIESAHGGRYAMQISRFGASNQASYVLSQNLDVTTRGVEVSAYALNTEASSGRYGTAIVSVFWYAHPQDNAPMLVTPVAAKTRLAEWTEIKGSAHAPPGAKAYSVALGMIGLPGSVAFDDVVVTANDDAQNWFRPHTFAAPEGMEWQVSETGGISLTRGDTSLIRDGRVLLYQTSVRGDPLDVLGVLTRMPQASEKSDALEINYRYFDPFAESEMILQVRLGGADGKALFNAHVRTESGSVSGASQNVSLHALATPAWVPAELVRLREIDDEPREYRSEIGVTGAPAEIGVLLSANTGTGNKIIAADKTQVTAGVHQRGRELFLQRTGELELMFERGHGLGELQERVSRIASVQPGEDQLDRVQRALSIFEDFVFNQNEIASAAGAVDAVSKHYALRLIELRDGINVPQLTRNEQLYRNAMREAIETAEKLNEAADAWESTHMPLLRRTDRDGMNDRTRQSASLARDALRELIDIAEDFEELAATARRSLFALELEIEQRESQPFMVSARDYLDSGQYVQGMVKLRAVVENYPRCLRGIEAKERMVDVAEILMGEYDDFTAQGMNNIARDRALQARELLTLVDAHLMSALLSETEQRWLRDMDLSGEIETGQWLDRERELKRRINTLRMKLPANLPDED